MATDLDALANTTTARTRITTGEMKEELAALGARWTVVPPDLRLTLKGPMTKTGLVAAHAGALADELDHHPNIALEYAGLTLSIHTHDKNGITVLDLVYAARLEQWLRANGW
jgi:pterin-4a-carbinolamine dehydratase